MAEYRESRMKHAIVLSTLLFLAGCSGGDVPSESPYEGQSAETFSMQLKHFRTIDGEKKLHWFQEYVTGYQEPDASKPPASLAALKTTSTCRLPKPDKDSKLIQIITWNSKKYAPLYSIDSDAFEKITKNVMMVVKGNRSPELALGKREGQLLQVDVAVTEKGPVHIILASTGPVLWNLVPAEHARITGISIISKNNSVAIANAPADVPVTALAGDSTERCGAIPSLMPVKEYPGVKMQLHRANDNDAKYSEKMAKYSAYNNYFRRQFGVDSDDVSIGVSVMDHAAIGPVPEPDARVPFKTLEGATIRATPGAFAFYGSEGDYVVAKKAAVISAASKIIGSDYKKVLDGAGF
jgi:hypothetical protein